MGTPRVALVTGASSGLGEHIAGKLLDLGYVVFGWARAWPNEHSYYHDPKFIPETVDVTNFATVYNALCNWQYDELDLLINNAGVFKEYPFELSSYMDIDGIIDINLKGAMNVTLACIKAMWHVSRIINIGSVSGLDGIENQAIYSASKAGLQAFSNSLMKELHDSQITTIIPGGIDTDLWKKHNVRDTSSFMTMYDVWKAIQFIIESDPNVTIKEIVMFPKEEYHP